MRNFKLIIEYDGAGFCGWQVQKGNQRTVQGVFEAVLLKIFKQPVQVHGSGRTDSGVHALGQVAHVKAKTRMKPLEIQKALNSLLPADVVVLAVKEVDATFHAQYSVKEKTYRYTILNRPTRSVFLRQRVYFYPYPVNVTLLRKAAKAFIGRHDFKSFQAHDPLRAHRDTTRTVKGVIVKQEGDLIYIDITADGFLYKMVRNMVGTLLAIASQQMPVDCIPKLLKAKDRSLAADTAPGEGLILMKVKY